jgi:anti-sigma regulatory factor (Ser/Thr protein kinase)
MQILNYNLEANIPYDEENIEKFLILCEEAIDNITKEEKPKYKLKSAVHELLQNSLEHGYGKNPGKVSISMKKLKNSIYFELIDEGSGLDCSTIELKREVSDLESATSRGWGLTLVSAFSKDLKIVPNEPRGTKVSLYIPMD